MSKCPHCGAEVQYKPETKKVHCEYCGSDFDVSELLQEYKKAKEVKDDSKPKLEGKAYSCTQCGATLLSFDETAVTFCSYCGSQNIIEEKMMIQNAPEVIIPFIKTKEQCIRNYKRHLSHFLFSPSYMKDANIVEKFRGIYMPYGIYKLAYKGDCLNSGEKYNHRSGDYIYYDDYTIHADVDASYDGISFDLMSKFYDEYSQSIPFNHKDAVPFNSNYLPGFYADSRDVEIGTYSPDAIKIGSNDSIRFLKKKWIFRKYNCNFPKVDFHMGEKKVGMFPVYFLAIRDKDNQHLHYAVINGQTGKVVADMPLSFPKYIIFSLLLAIPIFLLLNMLPIILPQAICFITIFASVIAWIICGVQLNACNEREGRYSDKGYMSIFSDGNKKPKRNKKNKKYKMKAQYWVKYLLAILLPLGIVILDPVSDSYYYLSSIMGLILVLTSFYDLVVIHNQLVSRPIPQLDRRGGDEGE